MKKIKKSNLVTLLIISVIQLLIAFYFFDLSRTKDLICNANFTRNAGEDYSFYYNGVFVVNLKRNGEGELTIKAHSNGKNSNDKTLNVTRSYTFEYVLDQHEKIFAHIRNETKGATDNVSDDFYNKYFFDLPFDSDGQIRISRFKNTYIFMARNIIVSICYPLE